MRLLLWVIVGVALAYAGLQFWRAWRLGAFGGGLSARSRSEPPAPPTDPYAFDLPEGPDALGDRSEPSLASPTWDLPPMPAPSPSFAPPPAATPKPVPTPQAPAFAPSPKPVPVPAPYAAASSAFAPTPPAFAPAPPAFAPAPPAFAPAPETFASAPTLASAPAGVDEGPEQATTHDEVLQVFERDLRALRHAIEVQRNTLGRLEADLHMLEKHLNGRQAPRRS